MITDQKQTGVPNRGAFSTPTRQRAQFVKPNQVNNIGRSGADQGRHGPAGTMQNTLPQMNPLRPANQSQPTGLQKMRQDVARNGAFEIAANTKTGLGNIDLTNRPVLKNRNGSISTVDSRSYGIDGKEVLLPTIARGANGAPMRMNDDQTVQRYRDTGEYLGKFDTVEESNAYAQALHKAQESQYASAAKSAVQQMSRSEINSLLDAIATGTLKGVD